MEILIVLILGLIVVTWVPVGMLTFIAYTFLDKKEIVLYDFTPEIKKSIAVWGWISLLLFVLFLPFDVLNGPIIGKIKNYFTRKAETRDNK